MKLAEKFGVPVFTFVDTPGAYPGIGAEERGQSEAIGRNIFEMAQLEVADHRHHHRRGRLGRRARDQRRRPAPDAAVRGLFSDLAGRLRVDPLEIRGARGRRGRAARHHRASSEGARPRRQDRQRAGRRGAHRDTKQMAAFLKRALSDAYRQVNDLPLRELLQRRYERLQSYGRFSDTTAR